MYLKTFSKLSDERVLYSKTNLEKKGAITGKRGGERERERERERKRERERRKILEV
jgi:hypothetical protein